MQGEIRHRWKPWLVSGTIILFVLLVLCIRVRLLDVPLERDVGKYANRGQLLLQGIPPYSEAYNVKLPVAYLLMHAGILSLFGQTVQGIHLGFMLLDLRLSRCSSLPAKNRSATSRPD